MSKRFWDAAVAVDPEAKRPAHNRYGSPKSLSDLWTITRLEKVEITALVIPMKLVHLTIYGIIIQISRGQRSLISLVSPRIADRR